MERFDAARGISDAAALDATPAAGGVLGLIMGIAFLPLLETLDLVARQPRFDDDEAAAIVRYFADGHETVPTVVIGEVGLVNPRAKDVLAVLGAEAPHLLPSDLPRPEQGKVGKLVSKFLSS